MKRITVLFFFLLSIFFTYGQEVTIGTGTETDRRPLSNYFGFERSAALYTAEEIGQQGFINKLAWDVGVTNMARPIKIYLKEVESAALSAASWSTFIDGAVVVYDGMFTPSSVGFNTINFDSSFNYTGGTKNLLVLVEANFGGGGTTVDGSNGLKIKATEKTNMHYAIHKDTDVPTDNLSAEPKRPNIKVTFGSQITCFSIGGTIANTTATSVGFTITERETTESIFYEVRTSGEGGSGETGLVASGTVTDITTSPIVIDGLTQTTTYSLYVRANCGGESVSYFSLVGTFRTQQIGASLPFTENFEGTINWTLSTGVANNWFVGTDANNGGTKSLYISENNGTTNTYNVSGGETVAHAYRNIVLPEEIEHLSVGFDWRCVGEGSTMKYDYFRVWLVPVSFTPTMDTQITAADDRIKLGGEFNLNPDFKRENFEVDVTALAGQEIRLVFEWRQDGSGGAQPPAAIDNIAVSLVTCSAPTAIIEEATTATTATVAWTAAADQETYEIYYSTSGEMPGDTITGSVVTTQNPYTIEGLTPSTLYTIWIRTSCNETDKSAWNSGTVRTKQIPATLPFDEKFEDVSDWSAASNTINKWFIGTAVQNGGTKSLYVTSDEGETNSYDVAKATVAHAYRDIEIPTGTQEVSVGFDWRCVGERNATSVYDYFRVWIVPTTFVPTPGTQISTATDRIQLGGDYNANETFTRELIEQNVAAFAGQTMRLVFEWRQDGSGGAQPPAAIDNVMIDVVTCSIPTNLQATATTSSSATIEWTAVTDQDTYEVYYSTTNTTPGETVTGAVTTTDNPHTITGLDPSTTYYVWIRTVCSPTDKSFWKQLSFETQQVPITLPYVEDFEGDFNWNTGTNSVNKWVVGTAAHNGGTKSMYITKDNGVTNSYEITASTVAHTYRDIEIPTETTEIAVDFDWRCVGEGSSTRYDYFRVWLVPVDFVPTSGTQITAATNRIQLGEEHNQQETFTRANYVQNVTVFAGQTMRLVFEWRQDGGGGDQPPAAIDNLNIAVITCSAPEAIQINGVTATSAAIAWTAIVGQDTYEVYYSTTNTTPGETVTGSVTTTENPYTIQGLSAATEYFVWVRTVCSPTDKSFWTPVSFLTGQIPAELPFEEDFEGENNWGLSSNAINKWVVGTAVNNGGTKALYVTKDEGATNSYDNTKATVAHAYRDINIPADAIEGSLSFDWRAVGEGISTPFDYIKVWLVTNSFRPIPGALITAAADRIQIGTAHNQQEEFSTELESVDLRPFAGSTARLVFEWRNDGGSGDDPAGAVDNVKLNVESCPSVTGLSACVGADRINYGWDSQEGMTRWEIAFQTTDGEAPDPANIQLVDEPNYSATGLTVDTTYYFFVRNSCENGVYSMWKKLTTKTSSTSILDAEPFCAGPEGIIFPNTNKENSEVKFPLGNGLRIACLGTVPYPVWYFLKVDRDGDLIFDIVQNSEFDANGDPIGDRLDVDFVAFGPFDSLDQACAESVLGPCPDGGCPSNTNPATGPYPIGNVVDCNYSSDAVETLTIRNAVRGQIYAVLITNFNGNPGFIKLVQKNVEENDAGTTDCKFLCEVDLGPDQYLCPGTGSFEIKADISTAGSTEDMEYTWFKDGEMMDPAVFNTNRLTVTETGTYRVRVEKDFCEENPEDEVFIQFYEHVEVRIPKTMELCDLDNVGYADFEVKAVVEQAIAAHAEAETLLHAYYLTLEDAQTGTNAIEIDELYRSPGNGEIYIAISRVKNPKCVTIYGISLNIKPTAYFNADFDYEAPICINNIDELPIVPGPEFTLGGAFSYKATSDLDGKPMNGGLSLNAETGTINVAKSKPGIYEVTYYYDVPMGMCGEPVSHTVAITIFDRFEIEFEGDCYDGKYYLRVSDVLGNINMDKATYTWSGPGGFTGDTREVSVPGAGEYTVSFQTQDGCFEELTIKLEEEQVNCLITKGISPNGDGLNDYFDLANYDVKSLKIFNRNGGEVYAHGTGYTVEWMGQDKSGNTLPVGTYFYVIETDQTTITGWVQLNY
ncbi:MULTISPECIES: fibronectin type III domain-containing protein [unclassified Myroides]|uniref:fibronectin type III domain-containing protein n=1 Tax=unclassified Myroides TaxID=2642485 RepID=UPI003D2F941D